MKSLLALMIFVSVMTSYSLKAEACPYCGLSQMNLLFPFLVEGTWILGIWRVGYFFFQREAIRQGPVRFVLREVLLLGILTLMMLWAGFFFYAAGWFVYVLFQSVEKCLATHGKDIPIPSLAGQAITLAILVPVALNAYRECSKLDELDRLRRFVYPGSAVSLVMTRKIAEDPDFDLNRIRELIEGKEDGDLRFAFEILHRRNSVDDLLFLEETILGALNDDLQIDGQVGSIIWLTWWLEKTTGEELKSKQELSDWILKECGRRMQV